MNGQCLGTYSDSQGGGEILVNIDERDHFYHGVAYTHPSNKALPSAAAVFRTQTKLLLVIAGPSYFNQSTPPPA